MASPSGSQPENRSSILLCGTRIAWCNLETRKLGELETAGSNPATVTSGRKDGFQSRGPKRGQVLRWHTSSHLAVAKPGIAPASGAGERRIEADQLDFGATSQLAMAPVSKTDEGNPWVFDSPSLRFCVIGLTVRHLPSKQVMRVQFPHGALGDWCSGSTSAFEATGRGPIPRSPVCRGIA